MAVTQYIGARYVPLFADPLQWDNERTYEPLTIVQHQGNSYTSRQAVPVGIDITNEDFWALTGNYNAQVEQYRQEVLQFDQRITANANANTRQDGEIAQNNSAIATETSRATAKENSLQENIQTETTRATAKEAELQNGISEVDTLAKANETNIASLETKVNKIISNIDTSKVANVRDLGAKGDGVTDDTQAFYKAIGTEGNPASYGLVIIPPGDYVVSEWLYLHSNLMIIGPGHIINAADHGGVFNWTCFAGDPEEKILENVVISGVEITSKGGKSGKENSGVEIYHSATDFVRAYNIVVMNCYIHEMGSRGISVYSGKGTGGGTNHPKTEIVIMNNKIEHCGNICVHILGSTAKVIGNTIYGTGDAEAMTMDDGCSDCIVIGNYFGGSGGGAGLISFDEADSIIIAANNFNGFGNTRLPCIRGNCGSGNINHLVIVGNMIGGGTNGISLGNDTKGHSVQDAIITGNVVHDTSGQPIWLSNNSRVYYGANACNWNKTDAEYIKNNGLASMDTLTKLLVS